MLIEFSVQNYLSFKDTTTLSMVAAKSFKEHLETNTIDGGGLKLLKSAVLYGNNGSGKSNLLDALAFMRFMVLNSFRDALIDKDDKTFPIQKFALNTGSEKEPSYFEVVFVRNAVRYRYGFELDYNKVVSEWLYHTTSKEVYLFKRNGQKFEINKSSFKEGVGKDEDVKENVLFMSLLGTLGKETATEIIEWFKTITYINGSGDEGHRRFTVKKLQNDPNFLNWVSYFIKYLEIANISTAEDVFIDPRRTRWKRTELPDNEAPKISRVEVYQITEPSKPVHLLTHHRRYDEHNTLIDTIPFLLDRHESEGTKKLIYLLGPWYDALKNGRLLLVDELDCHMHSQLSRHLINFFHRYNELGAQLIGAVHDTSLLNKDIFRRDQIYFIEKDQFGASNLVSLGDFSTDKVRSTSAFDKIYLEGSFGAVPYFEYEDKLLQLLYGEEK